MYFSRKNIVNSQAWFRKSNEDAGINGDPILPYPPRHPSDFNSEYIRVGHAVNVNSCHHNAFVISILHQVLRLGYSCNWRTNVKMCRALELESDDLGASFRRQRSCMKDEKLHERWMEVFGKNKRSSSIRLTLRDGNVSPDQEFSKPSAECSQSPTDTSKLPFFSSQGP